MPTEVNHEVSLEDVQAKLSDALGPAYRIKATSGSMLRVYRNPVIWGTVRVSWSGGKTAFHVRPGGFILIGMLNALTTVPKVRHALDRAFAD